MSTPTTPADRAATIERILQPGWAVLADPASPAEEITRARDVLRQVTGLIDALHGTTHAGTPGKAEPHDARARARESLRAEITHLEQAAEREAAGLRRLTKGRRQCEAETRNGGRCLAPAIPGGNVCRRHGGAAPQVRIQAALTLLYETRHEAGEAFEAARGGPGEFDALCKWSRADNAVKDAEAKIERIRDLQAELRRRRKATAPGPLTGPKTHGTDPGR